jgi:glycosyltransferase involved in cell wall biosynthesis
MAAWSAGGPRLITVGTLKPVKDQATLLRALVRIRQTHDARLLILGEGSERPKLEALVAELGLTDVVKMPGFRPDPHGYVAHADVFMLSSLNEGFGNVLVEAMACGTPVVSTDCPTGPGEILDSGRYGRLTPVGDADALAAAVLETLAAPPDPAVLIQRSDDFSTARAVGAYRRLLGV